jgi:uncharacterized protein (TIGR02466 family)|tara:strand:+ start:405 stop:1256 length:852 start_codon:yes stop_codon:yes gene_type:complete
MKAPVMPVDESEHKKVIEKIEETGISFSDWSEVEPTQYTPAPASLMQLFSIPFLRGNMEFDTDLIAESCRELVGDIEDGDVGREYTTYFDEEVRTKMHETEWFKDFSDKIKDTYITFIGSQFHTPVSHLKRSDIHLFAWINRYTGPHQHSSHNHVNSHMSGTYYVETTKSNQPIKFQSPNLMGNANHFAVDMSGEKEGFPNMVFDGVSGVDSFVQVYPVNDEFLLWPSYIMHSVEPSQEFIEDYERISISFNLKYRQGIDNNLTGRDMDYGTYFSDEEVESNR